MDQEYWLYKIKQEEIKQGQKSEFEGLLRGQTKNSTIEIDNESYCYRNKQLQGEEGLSIKISSNKQILLTSKVHELQKVCQTLTKLNKQLMDQMKHLQNKYINELQSQFNVQDLYSRINQYQTEFESGFIQIEKLIKQYRIMLKISQSKIEKRVFEKERANAILKQQIERLNLINLMFHKQNTRDNKLSKILQVENSKHCKQKKSSPLGTKQSDLNYTQPAYKQYTDFDYEIHAQLEILIEKLVNQLQNQRKIKQKMKCSINKLGQQLMQYQKLIMAKNTKIYLLQLSAVKKHSIKQPYKFPNPLLKQQDNLKKDSICKSSFNLIELLNNEIRISFIQKVYICYKILQIYEQKIIRKDFTIIMVQDLTINNLEKHKQHLITINCVESKQNEQYILNANNIIINIVFIMDSILNQVLDRQQPQQNSQMYQNCKQKLIKMLQVTASSPEQLPYLLRNLKDYLQQIINTISHRFQF